jgi:hypothetical protein
MQRVKLKIYEGDIFATVQIYFTQPPKGTIFNYNGNVYSVISVLNFATPADEKVLFDDDRCLPIFTVIEIPKF